MSCGRFSTTFLRLALFAVSGRVLEVRFCFFISSMSLLAWRAFKALRFGLDVMIMDFSFFRLEGAVLVFDFGSGRIDSGDTVKLLFVGTGENIGGDGPDCDEMLVDGDDPDCTCGDCGGGGSDFGGDDPNGACDGPLCAGKGPDTHRRSTIKRNALKAARFVQGHNLAVVVLELVLDCLRQVWLERTHETHVQRL